MLTFGRTKKFLTAEDGQATVEAAFVLPILFVVLLVLLQPGIIFYDRMVMHAAAAEGCRTLATQTSASGFDAQACEELVKRHLGAIPPHELFHHHDGGCSWEIECAGDENSQQVSVSIKQRIKLLPLLDVTGALFGITDGQGYFSMEVQESASTKDAWLRDAGGDPGSWVEARRL